MKKIILLTSVFASSALYSATFNIPNGHVTALINAINTANTNNEADIINLASNGSYTLTAINYTSLNPGQSGSEGQRGLPQVSDDVTGLDLTINGNGATIQRSASGPDFGLLCCSGHTIFNNLRFKNGRVNAQGGAIFVAFKGHIEVNNCSFYNNQSLLNAEGGGGGIYTKSLSVLTVKNSYFENNRAVKQGGAISNLLSDMTLLDNTFINNKTTGTGGGGAGGAVYSDGARGDNGALIVRNSFFEDNSCDGGGGGAMFLYPYRNQAVQVTGCTFRTNSAEQAGGFWHSAGGSQGIADPEYPLTAGPENTTLLLNNCIFDGNTCNTEGGGLWLSLGIINEIHSCTFRNNTAGQGGGLFLFTNRPLTIRNCTFNNNTADIAGGLTAGPITAKLTIQNCTFAANLANQFGGALYVPQNGTPVDIINCTFADNQVNNPGDGQSGAIHSENSDGNNTVMIKNNIFYNQTVTNPWNTWKNCNSVLNDGGNNLFFPENEAGRCVSTPDNSLFVHPLLIPLADNGGPTQTMALLPGSPAINAGSGCDVIDQRGFIRAGNCDIGAYEYGGVLSIKEHELSNIQVYPNPSTGEFAIKIPEHYQAKKGTIRIFTLEGKLILEKELDSDAENTLRLTEKGAYLVNTIIENQLFTNKILIH